MTDPLAAGFRGAATKLRPDVLEALANLHDYPLAMLEALIDVESSGTGFDAAGRPKILTEPHIFYERLGDTPKRADAVAAGLAYPRQGEKPYPATSELNYQRLIEWCGIDKTAALQSTSWGLAQVMGFNFAACGFASVEDMVLAAMDSEAQQLGFLLDYIVHAGLEAAIRNEDCDAIARGYNGPGAVAAYGGKLRAALARHRGSGTDATRPRVATPALRQAATDFNSLNDAEWLRIRGGQG